MHSVDDIGRVAFLFLAAQETPDVIFETDAGERAIITPDGAYAFLIRTEDGYYQFDCERRDKTHVGTTYFEPYDKAVLAFNENVSQF